MQGIFDTDCYPCTQGSYQPYQSFNSSCILCELGKYQKFMAQTSCAITSPGYYTSVKGSAGEENCDSGRYSDEYGSSTCKICGPGTYTQATTASSTCILCQPNTYTPFNQTERCSECEKGKYSWQYGATSQDICTPCLPCPPDEFAISR